MRRHHLVPLALSVALILGAWLFAGRPPIGGHPAPPPGVALTDLSDVAQLQRPFVADQGATRLILMLSPT